MMNLFRFLTTSDDLQMPHSWLSDTSQRHRREQ